MKVLEAMESKGYVLSDPHERINDGYKDKYGTNTLDNLGFFSTAKDSKLLNLFEKYPKIGGFSPFNMHIYRYSKDSKFYDDTTWYGHLDPYAMADIVGLKDKALRDEFAATFTDLDKLAADMLKPTEKKNIEYTSLPAEPMMEFTVDIDEDTELSDFIDEFQEKYEAAFEKHHYIIAGYKNFREAFADMGKKMSYDAYWVYSLCHFEFSNGVFKDRPDAGIFAPCAVYMYVNKGEKVLHIGMPKLENWINVMGVKDPVKVKAIKDLDAEIINIFKTELDAK
jgi:uncharacterized protein (DUF302 family)